MAIFLLLFISIMLFLNSIIDSTILLYPLKIFSGIIALVLALIIYWLSKIITKYNNIYLQKLEEEKRIKVNAEINKIIDEMKKNK